MWPRDERLALAQMIENAERALSVTRARHREELDRDWILRLGLTKAVEIVGEAATRVSAATQARFPEIPWREAIATRHRLIHGYDSVDPDQLWDTVTRDFPPLLAALRRALSELAG